ncbi:MAG TPA: aldehyde dehydrogenase family protein [Methanoregulaceae archaeon]|nr:aldehyde dehydrogenase family protein [Methanoregulaceae archaeon]
METSHPFLIGGAWRRSGTTVDVAYPYDGTIVGSVELATGPDLDDAVATARRGAEVMQRLPAHRRAAILHEMARRVTAAADELADSIVGEAGKTIALARAEVDRARTTLHLSGEEALRIGGEKVDLDWSPAGEGCTGLLRRVPVGVVFAITPFNFPLNLACHKIGPAIAAGNAVILRPSTRTPMTALTLGRIALEAGCPPESISVVPCRTPDAERLVAGPGIDLVSFTGSPAVGWWLRSIAGRKRVALELGGNAAVIVEPDADLAAAVPRIVNGGYANAGQVCISVQRVFLHRSLYDDGLEEILSATQGLPVGDPRSPATVVGPMISEEAAGGAEEKVREALEAGAGCEIGGVREGSLFQPTVLTRTRPEMRVNSTEVFAPVITVTPYDRLDEALEMANDSPFGLQQGLFTSNIRSIALAAERCRAGALIVNDVPTFRMDHMPYGGMKASGLGREGPRYAIEEMTERQLLVIRHG